MIADAKAAARAAANCTTRDDGNLKFVLDSGSTDYMVNNKSYFDDLKKIDPINIAIAKEGEMLVAKECGNISVKTFQEGKDTKRTISDVLFVKDLKCNLMSIGKLCDKGFEVTFTKHGATISKDGQEQFTANRNGSLYEIEFQVEKDAFAGVADEESRNKLAQSLWHQRLCHLNVFDMRKLIVQDMVTGIEKINVDTEGKFCEPCVMGKQSKLPFSKKNVIRSGRVLELIHTDVHGPVPEEAWDGSRYFVTFTDDFSRASMVYCMEAKSETFEKFREFVAMAEALHCKKVKQLDCGTISKLKSDNGGEYILNELKNYCKQRGIQIIYTVPCNPEMNGVAERLNRTLAEKARTMLLASNLGKRFWNEAVVTANYIKNRSPTSAFGEQFKNKTPAEIWYKSKPDLSHIKVFGSICYNHIPKKNRTKLDAKATKCIMLGYASSLFSYRLWDIENDKLIIGRHVTFNERSTLNPPSMVEISDSEEMEEVAEGNSNESIAQSEQEDVNENHLRRSNRIRKQPDRYVAWATKLEHYSLTAQEYVQNDPISISDAKGRVDWPKWKEAMEKEYSALIDNGTWVLTDLPPGRKTISCKWTFKLKFKADGTVDKHKARLVARGFTQEKGFDFEETYSPTAKYTTFRVLMSIANQFGYFVEQMDVKSAFLNGRLSEDIYMDQPTGFETEKPKVCKLIKSIYGLKQASRVWNETFHKFMVEINFKRCESDHCLYVKIYDDIVIFVLLFVDDLLMVSNKMETLKELKRKLSAKFEMTDVGTVESYLGIHVERKDGVMRLSQPHYMKNLLGKFGMENCKPATTPMEVGLHLPMNDDGPEQEGDLKYRHMIGCLMHATQTTRPDLCASTYYLSRFQNCFTNEHHAHAKRVLRYVQGTRNLKLTYTRSQASDILVGYSDSDWGGDKNDYKSTSGYVFKLFGNTVSWLSRKQSTIALSSTEAEYVALAEAVCEIKWLRCLLSEMGIECKEPTIIFEDNQSTIDVAEQPRKHQRMKHVNIKYNFIRDAIAEKEVAIKYIPSSDQLADIMTKSLGSTPFTKHRNDLGLRP